MKLRYSIRTLLIVTGVIACTIFLVKKYVLDVYPLMDLIEVSKSGKCIIEGPSLDAFPKGASASTVENYILGHPDASAYHLLFLLKKVDQKAYDRIPAKVKSEVLCAALQNCTFLNDWGNLDVEVSYDNASGTALLALGKVSLPHLQTLLDDKRKAPLFGSEDATYSQIYKYRRADFAYRYMMVLLNREPVFHEDPKERDKLIDSLKKELSRTVDSH